MYIHRKEKNSEKEVQIWFLFIHLIIHLKIYLKIYCPLFFPRLPNNLHHIIIDQHDNGTREGWRGKKKRAHQKKSSIIHPHGDMKIIFLAK